jgi:hypothetical protein
MEANNRVPKAWKEKLGKKFHCETIANKIFAQNKKRFQKRFLEILNFSSG